jgi:STAS domain-containing protein
MHGSTGGSWKRSTLTTATGVAQPFGKPAEHRPRDLPVSQCHRASSRPNHPRVRLLSAAGLAKLVDLRDRLTRADARLALAGAPPSVRRVLTITGLDDTMLLADSLHDAVRP